MEFLGKLERKVLGWFKNVPHLPAAGQKWLGDNIWWVALVLAILTGIGVLASLLGLFALISLTGTAAATYYATSTITSWAIVTSLVSLAFSVLEGILLAVSVQPLKAKQKKGWVLLFAVWLLGILAVFVNAVLTLSVFGFIFGILFGAIWVAVTGYFLFEIHNQFAHVERSRGVKEATVTK